MKELGIAGSQQSTYRPQGTDSHPHLGYFPNVLKTNGAPVAPDQMWVSDTIYLPTRYGWPYPNTVMIYAVAGFWAGSFQRATIQFWCARL